jgi:ComF family protein
MAGSGVLRLAQELIFPSICRLCEKPAEPDMPLCNGCLSRIEFIQARCDICGESFAAGNIEHVCGDCALDRPSFEKARAWVKFRDPVTSIVHRFKYQHGFYFADWMVTGMIEVFRREYGEEKFDVMIPVPLHWMRLLTRGYNQALILARPLSRKLKIPIAPGALARRVNNPPQVGLSRAKRIENLKKVFAVKNPKQIKGKNILLVDDVITTGATVSEAAKVLVKAGAETVSVLAFGRA